MLTSGTTPSTSAIRMEPNRTKHSAEQIMVGICAEVVWGFGVVNFGNHVAEYNSEYGGLSPNMAEAQHLHNQRVDNARGGLGFLTSAEVRRIEAHAYLKDPITGRWTPFEDGDAVWIVGDESSFSILNAAKRVAWSVYDMNTPDGVQFNGSLIWVFSINVTVTKDLDVFGGVETPNV